MADIRYSQADNAIMGKLQNHLQRHEDKLDPHVENHRIVLFGKNNDDGIVSEVRDMQKLKNDIHGLKWMLIGTVAAQVLLSIFVK